MTEIKTSFLKGVKFGFGLALLPFGLALLKVIGLIEETYILRREFVRRGWLSYTHPDAEAIRQCDDCGYVGVLAIDKHRPAAMSKVNWELRCPECSTTYEGPIQADDVADYINYCRSAELLDGTISSTTYATFQAVQTHNSKHALPKERLEELQSLADEN